MYYIYRYIIRNKSPKQQNLRAQTLFIAVEHPRSASYIASSLVALPVTRTIEIPWRRSCGSISTCRPRLRPWRSTGACRRTCPGWLRFFWGGNSREFLLKKKIRMEVKQFKTYINDFPWNTDWIHDRILNSWFITYTHPIKNCVVFASPKNQANHQEPLVTALLKVEDLCILGWIFAKMIEIFGEFVSMQQTHHLGTLNMFWISSMTCCCSPHLTSMSISAFHLKHLPSNIPDQISCFFWILLVSRYAYKIPRCLKLPLHCTPLNSKTSICI